MPVLTFSSFLGFQNRKFGGGAVAQLARKLLLCEVGDTGLYQEPQPCRPPRPFCSGTNSLCDARRFGYAAPISRSLVVLPPFAFYWRADLFSRDRVSPRAKGKFSQRNREEAGRDNIDRCQHGIAKDWKQSTERLGLDLVMQLEMQTSF